MWTIPESWILIWKKKIGKLLQADELNDGNLSETLENYLNWYRNAKKTAEEMFLHRNTLNYRLKKIRGDPGMRS